MTVEQMILKLHKNSSSGTSAGEPEQPANRLWEENKMNNNKRSRHLLVSTCGIWLLAVLLVLAT